MKQLCYFSVLGIFIFPFGYNCISTPQSDHYVAAVIEYRLPSSIGSTREEVLNVRLTDYINQITHPNANDVDIFVFPDGTLNEDLDLPQRLPDVLTNTIPCGNNEFNDSFAIQSLSCAARDSQKYIVTNLIGLINSTNELYNVNVVFNRLGQLISFYRCYNLRPEITSLSVPNPQEISHFDTDFGVRFGHLITRDLISLEPVQSLLNLGIRDYVFPNKWQTILPFLAGTQSQQAWAYSNSVNLLAASQNDPKNGKSGSGIYSGRAGALATVISGSENINSIILVSRISKIPGQIIENGGIQLPIYQDIDRIHSIQDNFENYHFEPIIEVNGVISGNTCTRTDFCCEYAYSMVRRTVIDGSASYQYGLFIFSGKRVWPTFSAGGVSVCAIVACRNSSEINTCGTRFPAGTIIDQRYVFNALRIGSRFSNESLPVATTLTTNLVPINVAHFTYEKSENWYPENGNGIAYQNVSMMLSTNYVNQFLTFGIYARQSSASILSQSFIGLIIIKVILVAIIK